MLLLTNRSNVIDVFLDMRYHRAPSLQTFLRMNLVFLVIHSFYDLLPIEIPAKAKVRKKKIRKMKHQKEKSIKSIVKN